MLSIDTCIHCIAASICIDFNLAKIIDKYLFHNANIFKTHNLSIKKYILLCL